MKRFASLPPLRTLNNFILCYVTESASLPGGTPSGLRNIVRNAAAVGVDWIQIREKKLTTRELFALVSGAVQSREGTRIIVNDRLEIAVSAGAGGVHLGGESIPVAAVAAWRNAGRLSRGFLIGASCHSIDEVQRAENAGADYAIFGPVFATPSKGHFGEPQGIVRLEQACRTTKLPVLAIGGITAENACECRWAGAAGIAAIRLFQQASDLHELVQRLRQQT